MIIGEFKEFREVMEFKADALQYLWQLSLISEQA